MATTIGEKVVSGLGGSTDISGIVKAFGTPSINNQTSGKITLADLNTIYFGVNRWYRAQQKCAWLMNDRVYEFVRAATDNNGRPLLDVQDNKEILFGKPVYVCPGLANAYTSILYGPIIFGDLSHIVIRASRPQIQHSLESGQADITRGECLYIGRCRADSSYFDPSSGANPPVVLTAIS